MRVRADKAGTVWLFWLRENGVFAGTLDQLSDSSSATRETADAAAGDAKAASQAAAAAAGERKGATVASVLAAADKPVWFSPPEGQHFLSWYLGHLDADFERDVVVAIEGSHLVAWRISTRQRLQVSIDSTRTKSLTGLSASSLMHFRFLRCRFCDWTTARSTT